MAEKLLCLMAERTLVDGLRRQGLLQTRLMSVLVRGRCLLICLTTSPQGRSTTVQLTRYHLWPGFLTEIEEERHQCSRPGLIQRLNEHQGRCFRRCNRPGPIRLTRHLRAHPQSGSSRVSALAFRRRSSALDAPQRISLPHVRRRISSPSCISLQGFTFLVMQEVTRGRQG